MSRRGAFEQRPRAGERAFLRFLPGDNAVTLPESETVLRMMTQDLAWLLRLDDADFWKAVVDNPSLCLSLDAFLHYRQRPCDSHDTTHLDSTTLKRLTQQYFFFVLRLYLARYVWLAANNVMVQRDGAGEDLDCRVAETNQMAS